MLSQILRWGALGRATMTTLFALSTFACVAESGEEQLLNDSESVGSTAEEIQGGTPVTAMMGVVSIGANGRTHWCTGSMINEHVIVTARHCLDDETSEDIFTIWYFDPETGTKRRITNVDEKLKYARHPDVDLALIFRAKTWDGTGHGDYPWIFGDDMAKVSKITIYGAGPDDDGNGWGDLEALTLDVDSFNKDRFFTTALADGHVCGGDSGAPVLYRLPVPFSARGRFNILTAVHSSSAKDAGNNCTSAGKVQRHTRVDTKLSWIEAETRKELGKDAIDCEKVGLGWEGSTAAYRCWVPPK